MSAIPKIIHQTAKTKSIPEQWKALQNIVRETYPEWEYRLWTDEENLELVRQRYPQLLDTYESLERPIMRVDLIRYLIMDTYGGLYLDLDYEFLRPYPFETYQIVLPRESEDDDDIRIGNAVFASVPGHSFWKAVVRDLEANPPIKESTVTEKDVIDLTGPGFLTRIYRTQFQSDPSVTIPGLLEFNPPIPTDRTEYRTLQSNQKIYGIHYCHGTWRALTVWQRLAEKIRTWSRRR